MKEVAAAVDATNGTSDSGAGKQEAVGAVESQLLEVYSAPDLGLVSQLHPRILDDADVVLFVDEATPPDCWVRLRSQCEDSAARGEAEKSNALLRFVGHLLDLLMT